MPYIMLIVIAEQGVYADLYRNDLNSDGRVDVADINQLINTMLGK